MDWQISHEEKILSLYSKSCYLFCSLYLQCSLSYFVGMVACVFFVVCLFVLLVFFNSVFIDGPRENIPYDTSCFIRAQSLVIHIFFFSKHNPFFFEIGFLWSYIINCIRHILEELDETWKVKALVYFTSWNKQVRLHQVKKMITVKKTVNWKLCMKKSTVFPQKVKNWTTIWSSNPIPGCISIGIEISTLKRDLLTHVHCRIVWNNQDMEIT